MKCDEANELLSEHLDDALLPDEHASVAAHLEACPVCTRELAELRWVKGLLRSVPPEAVPTGLGDRIHAALMALPDQAPDAVPTLVQAPVSLPSVSTPLAPSASASPPAPLAPVASFWKKAFNWPSALTGAAVAAALIGFWQLQPSNLPRIETAAVSVKTDVAMNIGFDVDRNMDNVTFQIDLPDGLQFVDERSQPLAAQSVSWKGSLKKGNTVIPIVVRGVRPGRYEVEAYVKKGPMMRKTTIVLPVQAT